MNQDAYRPTREQLESAWDEILAAPKDRGVLKLIARRPRNNEREVLDQAR